MYVWLWENHTNEIDEIVFGEREQRIEQAGRFDPFSRFLSLSIKSAKTIYMRVLQTSTNRHYTVTSEQQHTQAHLKRKPDRRKYENGNVVVQKSTHTLF